MREAFNSGRPLLRWAVVWTIFQCPLFYFMPSHHHRFPAQLFSSALCGIMITVFWVVDVHFLPSLNNSKDKHDMGWYIMVMSQSLCISSLLIISLAQCIALDDTAHSTLVVHRAFCVGYVSTL